MTFEQNQKKFLGNNFDIEISIYERIYLLETLTIFSSCRSWELTGPWTGLQIKVPVKFIVGDLDLTYSIPGVKEYIHSGGFKKLVPNLQDAVAIEGAAHFINQERPEEVNALIHEFIKKF